MAVKTIPLDDGCKNPFLTQSYRVSLGWAEKCKLWRWKNLGSNLSSVSPLAVWFGAHNFFVPRFSHLKMQPVNDPLHSTALNPRGDSVSEGLAWAWPWGHLNKWCPLLFFLSLSLMFLAWKCKGLWSVSLASGHSLPCPLHLPPRCFVLISNLISSCVLFFLNSWN